MDPVARPVSPYSIKGLALGARNLYGQAVGAATNGMEAVRPLPTVAAPAAVAAPVAVAPAPVAAPAVDPAAVAQPAPTIGGAINAIQQRQQMLQGLKDGGMVSGPHPHMARGARRKAMPGRGDTPHKPIQRLRDGGQVEDRGGITYQQDGRGLVYRNGQYDHEPDTLSGVPLPGQNRVVSRNSGPTDASGNSFEIPLESGAGAGRGKVNPAPARGARKGFKHGGQVDRDPSGEVEGPGTGTSDSVPAEMPPGTYVMPADTTQKVNLSDGEFKVPPEVVMAAGAAALDVVRQATHTPAAAQEGADDEAPGFNNGGKVCHPAKGARRGYANGGMVAKKNSHGRPSYADGGMVTDEDRAVFGLYPQMAGGRRTSYATDAALRTGVQATGPSTFEPAARMNVGVRGLPAGVQPSTAGAGRGSVNPPLASTTPTAVATPAAATTPALATTPAAVRPAAAKVATGMVQGEAAEPGSSGAQASLGAEAVPVAAAPNQSQQNIATMQRAGQTYREIAAMQNAGGNAPAVIGADPAAERNAQFDRDVMIQRAARVGGRGARAMLDVVAAGDRAAADLAGTQMREAGATQRAGLQEAGATAREQARMAATGQTEAQRLELEGRRVATGEQEAAVRIGAGRQQLAEGERLAKLRAKLDATTDPAQRRAIQDQLLAEQGKQPQANRFTVVPGGSGVDPTTGQVVREASQVLDNQTGQFVQQGQGARTASVAPPAAAVAKLKGNPQLAAAFDQKYGPGAAQRALAGQ